jgi:hypothetical protein
VAITSRDIGSKGGETWQEMAVNFVYEVPLFILVQFFIIIIIIIMSVVPLGT